MRQPFDRRLAIASKTFAHEGEVRRGVEADRVPVFGEDRGEERRSGALPVTARDVDRAEAALGMSEGTHDVFDPGESEEHPEPRASTQDLGEAPLCRRRGRLL